MIRTLPGPLGLAETQCQASLASALVPSQVHLPRRTGAASRPRRTPSLVRSSAANGPAGNAAGAGNATGSSTSSTSSSSSSAAGSISGSSSLIGSISLVQGTRACPPPQGSSSASASTLSALSASNSASPITSTSPAHAMLASEDISEASPFASIGSGTSAVEAEHISFEQKQEELLHSGGSDSDSESEFDPAAAAASAAAAAARAAALTVSEKEEELRLRWAHLPEPSGPGPFPEFKGDPETHMWTSPVWASAIDMRRHIFCNRSLNMDSIVAVGFDMDYTLAQYRADTFELLTYRSTISKLVHTFGYPEELLTWRFDWRYMIRGLVLDKKRGNILKMDRHKYVKVAYHGFRSLSAELRRSTYNSTRNRESFDEPDYALIDTLFSLAEAYLFAQLVDFADQFPERCPGQVVAPGTRHVSYEAIYKNVRSAVDFCHRDGTLKSAVAQDPQKYLHKDDQIVPMLKMLRDSGRKVFLVTNSLWDYTHVVMNCIVGNCGTTPETQRDYEWLKLFDVVVTGSAKPGFFQDNNRAPVFEVEVNSGMLINTDEGSPAAQIGDLPAPNVTAKLNQACQVYQGGSVAHLHRLLNIASGSHVLYVGDHIYGDILRSKKTLGWRTMLVIPELVREVHVLNRTGGLQRAFHGYRHQIDSLDDTIQRMAWALRFDDLPQEKQRDVEEEMEVLKVQREIARKKYRAVMDQWHSHFHPIWGMLMKTGYQNSRFGHQIERFACLYTSHVANLAYYSPDKNYRTVEDFMPHEVDSLNR